MSIKQATYYWVECDGCGTKSTDGGDFSAWSDLGAAKEEADAREWITLGGKDYCWRCWPYRLAEQEDEDDRRNAVVPKD